MGLWDSVSNFLSGGARDDADEGYDQANQFFAPYRSGGNADYNRYRGYAEQFGNNLAPSQTAGNWQHEQINQSPSDYYNQIMHGYAESPQAKYEQEQAMRAATAGGSASGMLGSGAFNKSLQNNAADISARDQQRYFGNVMGANNMQMGYLDDLRNQQNTYNSMQQYLTNLGYGATGVSGENSINKGLSRAKYDQSAFDSIMGMIGMGGQSYANRAAMGGGIPAYAQSAIMAG